MQQTLVIGDWKAEQARLALAWKLAEYEARLGFGLGSEFAIQNPFWMMPVDQIAANSFIRPRNS